MMRRLNNIIEVLLAFLSCTSLLVVGCTEAPMSVPVSGVTLDTEFMELMEGETSLLNATVSPSNATNKKLLWSSSNSTIVTVSEGVVNALKPGSSKVTVKTDDGGKIAICEVVVKSNDAGENEGNNDGNENEGGGENAGGENTGGEENEDKGPATLTLGNVTATTATFTGHFDAPASDLSFSQVTVYYSDAETFNMNAAESVSATSFDKDQNFTIILKNLKYNTKYNYCMVAEVKSEKTYGDVLDFTTENVTLSELSVISSCSKAEISGSVIGLSEEDKKYIEVGIIYSSETGKVDKGEGTKLVASEISSDNSVSFALSELVFGTIYYYRSYVKQGGVYLYGDVLDFTSINVTLSELSVVPSCFEAEVRGLVTGLSEEDKEHIKVGVLYSSKSGNVENGGGKKIEATEISADGVFSVRLSDLTKETKYYYCSYVKQGGSYTYGTPAEFTTLKHPYDIQHDLNVSAAKDMSSSGSANCYIVSESGLYKFKTVKGSSNESVGSVAWASILWETFGTDTAPELLELIGGFCFKDGYIAFKTAETFKEGNAVIAAKDADGNILWSWHIWFTDQPQGQVYYNNAGTMMDRNLGATSATPGDVGALGLLYQWGRKDPFLGSSSISSSTVAKSTSSWPSSVSSNTSKGTIAYATANPTTFITSNNYNYDWYYTGNSSKDNTRWSTSVNEKSIYDPCPSGWRVPDGGHDGVWAKAIGSSSDFIDDSLYSSTSVGMNFSGKFGSDQTIWYPASGCHISDGSFGNVGYLGGYWSASPDSYGAYVLDFLSDGSVSPSSYGSRAFGVSVRCLQE